jgi:hypothetical protein
MLADADMSSGSGILIPWFDRTFKTERLPKRIKGLALATRAVDQGRRLRHSADEQHSLIIGLLAEVHRGVRRAADKSPARVSRSRAA